MEMEKKNAMQPQDIECYLVALDQALFDQGIVTPIPVLLLGGAYITLQINARRATNDIDVFPFVQGDTDQATGIPLAVALYLAIQAVTEQYRLRPTWFNTIRIGALQPRGVVPQRKLWKKYQVLEVYLPEPEYVLVQKLLIHRRKDRQDIVYLLQTLGITEHAQAQALLDRYVSPEEQKQQKLPLLLRSYFSS
jgi:hypothetical protein